MTHLTELAARVEARVDAEIAERNERIAALNWCRRNGNPHLPTSAKD